MITDTFLTAQVPTLAPHHQAELAQSLISPRLASLNFRSIYGAEFEELILATAIAQGYDKTGTYAKSEIFRLRKRHKNSFDFGGWYCAGEDVARLLPEIEEKCGGNLSGLTDEKWAQLIEGKTKLPRNPWGCFKADVPRKAEFKRDRQGNWQALETATDIKYEHPAKEATSAFLISKVGAPRLYLEALANSELPVFITEGAKKAACLVGAGYIAIGLPGVAMWNKPKTQALIDELAMFARKGRTFYIAFDQDTKKKAIANVSKEICKLSSALRKTKAAVKVVSWSPAKGKGVDDLMLAHGAIAFEQAVEQAVGFEYWAYRYHSRMSYEISYTVPASQRYLDGKRDDADNLLPGEVEIPFPVDARLIALIAPKGTGKTDAISRRIRRRAAASLENGRRVLLISHRVKLTQAFSTRTGIPSVYEITSGKKDDSQGMSLCIQSLHPNSQAAFNADDWDNVDVYFDEVEQGLWELLNSETCKGSRVSIMRQLRSLIKETTSAHTSGSLTIADADLSNNSLDFILGIAEDENLVPWIVKSGYKGDDTACQVSIYPSNIMLLSGAEQAIEAGKRLLVVTDSMEAKSMFGSTSLTERWATKYPDVSILTLDGLTTKILEGPAYSAMEHLNAIAPKYQIIITSPVMETGISLDIRGHFDLVVGFFQGVIGENSVRQSLARLRDNVPRHIALPNRGLSFIGGGEMSSENLEVSQDKQAKAAISLIFDGTRSDIDSSFCPTAVHAWASLAARQNAGMSAYREIVAEGLRIEGHQVSILDKPADEFEKALQQEAKESMAEDRHTRLVSTAAEIIAADDISPAQLAKAEKSSIVKNLGEHYAVKKALLTRLYPEAELNTDLYILDSYGYHRKLKLHYALTMGNAFIKPADQLRIKDLMDGSNDGEIWALDVVRSTLSLKTATLKLLKIDELIQLSAISNASPEVLALAAKAWDNRAWLKGILGFTITAAEMEKPVLIAKKFLALVGWAAGKAQRVRMGGDQIRVYPLEQVDHKLLSGYVGGEFKQDAYRYECDRQIIFKGWLNRDEMKAEKAASEEPIIHAHELESECPDLRTSKTPNSFSIKGDEDLGRVKRGNRSIPTTLVDSPTDSAPEIPSTQTRIPATVPQPKIPNPEIQLIDLTTQSHSPHLPNYWNELAWPELPSKNTCALR